MSAMSAKSIAVKRLVVLRIGCDDYLMPQPKALQVFAALGEALRVDPDYAGGRTRWVLREEPSSDRVEMTAVDPRDVVRRPERLMIEGRRG